MQQQASNDINEHLTIELMQTLDCDDKELFVKHFHLYLIYGTDPTKFVVDLDDVWQWLGFSRYDVAKRVLLKNFVEKEDYEVFHPKVENPLGGRPKDYIRLNVESFKSLCIMSETVKGKQTRRYYSKIESAFFKIMEKQSQMAIKEMEEEKLRVMVEMKQQKQHEIQKKLIETNKNTPLVYILKIQETDENNFIIKIGETDDIEKRITSLRQEYKDCVLIDVFPCFRPHAVEQYILHRNDVSKHRFIATETIKISEDFKYTDLLKIIKKNLNSFDNLSPTQRIELARLRYREKLIDTINESYDSSIKQQLIHILDKWGYVSTQ